MFSLNMLFILFACYPSCQLCNDSSHLLFLLPNSRKRQSSSAQNKSIDMPGTWEKTLSSPLQSLTGFPVAVSQYQIWAESQNTQDSVPQNQGSKGTFIGPSVLTS